MASVGSAPADAPRPLRRAVAGSTVGLILIGTLAAGITAAAQHLVVETAEANDFPPGLYSLPRHVLATVVLAGFTVMVSTMAGRRCNPWTALIVVVGVALGPMELVGAPVRADLFPEFATHTVPTHTVPGWHLGVAAAAALLLALSTAWNLRCLGSVREPDHSRPAAGSVFTVTAAGAAVVQIVFGYSANGDSPGLVPIVGWAVLAGATAAVVVHEGAAWKISALLLLGSAVTPPAMYLAYHRREGGWPGVAGWELHTSPIVVSVAAASVLLAPSVLGLLWSTGHALAGALDDDTDPAVAVPLEI